MVGAWPEPVERVSSFLRESGVEARIHEFPDGTPTAQDAATAAGCELDQIVKSLVLVCDERPVVVFVPGDRRCDPAEGRSRARCRSLLASRRRPKWKRPPASRPVPSRRFRSRRSTTVLMERALYRHSLVWAGAGSSRHMLAISPSELGRLTRARPMDVVTERTYDSSRPKES